MTLAPSYSTYHEQPTEGQFHCGATYGVLSTSTYNLSTIDKLMQPQSDKRSRKIERNFTRASTYAIVNHKKV